MNSQACCAVIYRTVTAMARDWEVSSLYPEPGFAMICLLPTCWMSIHSLCPMPKSQRDEENKHRLLLNFGFTLGLGKVLSFSEREIKQLFCPSSPGGLTWESPGIICVKSKELCTPQLLLYLLCWPLWGSPERAFHLPALGHPESTCWLWLRAQCGIETNLSLTFFLFLFLFLG